MRPPYANPFRVDRVTALPYLGEDIPVLADRFLTLGQAAIVGPHGVGKSTLLRAIGDELKARGETLILIQIPGSATPAEQAAALAPLYRIKIDTTHAPSIILIDGYEQLIRRHRSWTDWLGAKFWDFKACRAKTSFGIPELGVRRLLVTTHQPSRLPTLITLQPTPATLDRVLTALLPTITPDLRAEAHAAFAYHRGDIRETLMTLYDAWAASDLLSPLPLANGRGLGTV